MFPAGQMWLPFPLLMPVSLTIDTERKLTITTGEGVVTDADFIDARRQLIERPDFDPSFDRIWDFQRVTEARVTEEVIARLVAESPNADDPIRRAVVISGRAEPMKATLHFIGRTRQANRRIAAFPSLASAEQWILSARTESLPA